MENGQRRKSAKKEDESPPVTPDSTTEPPPRPIQPYQEGDDVFFHTDDGQLILGTVGQIVGQTCQILFGDGTQQWASFKRIKKMSCDLNEDDAGGGAGNSSANHAAQSYNSTVDPRKIGRQSAPALKNSSQNSSFDKTDLSHMQQQTDANAKLSCFHCERGTKWYNRVHCNLCDRPCHLMCLSLTPPPLNGDNKFWDLMCSSCGTQNSIEAGKVRVFSVRRNISSWADIVHLIISCKTVETKGQKYFDLHTEIMPFLDTQLGRLHLPSKFKHVPLDERRKNIEFALINSQLRFINGKDSGERRPLNHWAIRQENYTKQNHTLQNGNRKIGEKLNRISISRQSMDTAESGKLKRKYAQRQTSIKIKEIPKTNISLQGKVPKLQVRLHTEQGQPCPPKVAIAKRPCEPLPRSASKQPSCDIQRTSKILSTSELKKKLNNIPAPIVTKKNGYQFNESSSCSSSSSISSSSSLSSCSTSSSASSNIVRIPLPPSPPSSSSSTSSSSTLGPLLSTPSKTAEPDKEVRGRGRPKGRGLKRPIPPSPSCPPKIPRNGSSPKRNILQVRLPFQTKPKKNSISPRKVNTSTLTPVHPSTPSPVRAVKVATISPPKLIISESKSQVKTPSSLLHGVPYSRESSDSESSDSETTLQKNSTNLHKTDTTEAPRAVKTASVVPAPAPQIQVLLRKGSVAVSARGGQRGRPKINRGTVKLLSRDLGRVSAPGGKVLRLRPRGRGRPVGSKNHAGRAPFLPGTNGATSSTPKLPQSTSSSGAGLKSGHGAPLFTKRVSSSNLVFDKSKAVDDTQGHGTDIAGSLLDLALFADYRLHCLPHVPLTDSEKQKEALKVFGHYRTEKEDEMAALLLGRSETESRSQSRRKSELFGLKKRDLTDFDSYDILGKRVDPDGTTRYFIAWKIPGLEDSESDSDYEDGNVVRTVASTKTNPASSPNIDEIADRLEGPSNFPIGCLVNTTALDRHDFIDLTDSS